MDPDRDYQLLFRACRGLNVPVLVTTVESRLAPLRPLPDFVRARSLSPQELVAEYNDSMVIAIPLNTKRRLNDAMGCSTIFESMMMGKAIVATRTFTTESYITNGETGILVDEGDEEGFRKAFQLILNNEELRNRLGKNARDFAVANLDFTKCTEKLSNYFKSL